MENEREYPKVKGTYRKKCGTWVSEIRINNKRKYLGSFITQEKAYERYLEEVIRVSKVDLQKIKDKRKF